MLLALLSLYFPSSSGGGGGSAPPPLGVYMERLRRQRVERAHREALLSLLAAGAITPQEYVVLLASESGR